jgi:hypothetical protein
MCRRQGEIVPTPESRVVLPSLEGSIMLNKAISQYPNNTFEPEVVTAMGRAFDLAMPEILASADPKAQSEAVAKRIVEIARLGERDPHMLCAYGLARSGPRAR